MAEPAAVWSLRQVVFDRSISTTQNIILSFARDALHAMIHFIDQLHRDTANKAGNQMFYAEGYPTLLTTIVIQQALAATILFRDEDRGKNEKPKAFAIRKERADYIGKKCTGLALDTLKNKKIRNSITHIDEYLAKELDVEQTGWFIDDVVSNREFLVSGSPTPNIAFCRCYVAGEDKLLNFGNEIVLSDLKNEALQVLHAVWAEPLPPNPVLDDTGNAGTADNEGS
jgi:hypothetical protein